MMLGAVVGYYNGEHIVLDEKVSWDNGQEVIVTVLPKSVAKSPAKHINFSEFRSGGRYDISMDAQEYIKELRGNDRV